MKFALLGRYGALSLFIFLLCFHEFKAATNLDAERTNLALKAAQSAAAAMKALTFVKWISKIGTVAGPILSVAIMIVEIIFSFLDIPSAEMIYMKEAFKNLNIRLDEFGAQFGEIKKKIDWSAIQLNYESYESTIRVMTQERMKLIQVKDPKQRDSAKKTFIRKFENDFPLISEKLYFAMSSESVLTRNLFEAVKRYSDQDPERSFIFMKGCTQLLMQSFAIHATYIHLKYNNKMADEYFKKIAGEKMKNIVAKAKSVYYAEVNNWNNQMPQDIKRIALTHRSLSNKDFTNYFFNYISSKYIDRRWFVIVYNPIWTWEKHGASVCWGGHFFRLANRNIVIASYARNWNTGWSHSWANGILNFGLFRRDSNGAKALMDKVLGYSKSCHPVVSVAVVQTGSNTHWRASDNRIVHKVKYVKWCNTNLCWIKKNRAYDVVVFG